MSTRSGADEFDGGLARFGADVAAALAGSLNLRRTLGCVVDLAVPELGGWAAVTLWDPVRVRMVSVRAGRAAQDRSVAAGRVRDADRRRLQDAMEGGISEIVLRDPAELTAFGAAGGDAALLLTDGPRPATVASSYRPAREATEIGGDFYDVRPDGSGWSFTVGDVCGKGVEAAVLTGQVRHSLGTVSLLDPRPGDRLRLLNDALMATDGTSFRDRGPRHTPPGPG